MQQGHAGCWAVHWARLNLDGREVPRPSAPAARCTSVLSQTCPHSRPAADACICTSSARHPCCGAESHEQLSCKTFLRARGIETLSMRKVTRRDRPQREDSCALARVQYARFTAFTQHGSHQVRSFCCGRPANASSLQPQIVHTHLLDADMHGALAVRLAGRACPREQPPWHECFPLPGRHPQPAPPAMADGRCRNRRFRKAVTSLSSFNVLEAATLLKRCASFLRCWRSSRSSERARNCGTGCAWSSPSRSFNQ